MHSDASPFFRSASDFQAAAVETGDLEAQGKAEAGAALLSGAGFIYHIKGLCDPGDLILGDADPFILYKDPGGCPDQADAGTGRAGFAGVVDEVGEKAEQEVGVPFDMKILFQVDLQAEILFFQAVVGDLFCLGEERG